MAEPDFFSRWSQRKLAERQAKAPPKPALRDRADLDAGAQLPTPPVPVPTPAPAPAAALDAAPDAAPAGPTLQDVAALHKDSDFTPFVSRAVQPQVRNAAMRKMFSDPHFNVMDGLDTYIDDYAAPDPLPMAMLRQLASAQFLGLFDDEKSADKPPQGAATATAGPREDADGTAPPTVAQSQVESAPLPDAHAAADADATPLQALPEPDTGGSGGVPAATGLKAPDNEDTDLRLQPDHAAGPARPGRGTE